jgi:hypothetical protein
MSSFVGHSLAAVSIYTLSDYPITPLKRRLWLGWLVVLACAPDIDYLIPALRLGSDPIVRITHSIFGSLLLPLLTIVILVWRGFRDQSLAIRSRQVIAAGLSHLVLDLLVGVTPLPLFWPFSFDLVHLPFGILPSAGRIDLHNPLLYINLYIELGVLVPLVIVAYLIYRHRIANMIQKVISVGLIALSLSFMLWASNLSR